ncbi:MAG: globin [Acidimicrobiales bacterium]
MTTVYDALGGLAFFESLVERFYEQVATDPVLRPMYPEDLTGSRTHLALFLAQYWGGPTTYSDDRGHPRLRSRHMPFVIGEQEAAHWYAHMRDAVNGSEIGDESLRVQLLDYFASAAQFLINEPLQGDARGG